MLYESVVIFVGMGTIIYGNTTIGTILIPRACVYLIHVYLTHVYLTHIYLIQLHKRLTSVNPSAALQVFAAFSASSDFLQQLAGTVVLLWAAIHFVLFV